MTEEQKQAKLDEISKILADHGIYIAFRSPEIYLQIFYKNESLVDLFHDSFGIELGETDLPTEY